MNKSDRQVNIILIFTIAVYLAVLVVEIQAHFSAIYIPFLNAVSSAAVIIYWIRKQLKIKTHIFDIPEISVLCAEVLIAGFSAYSFLSHPEGYWLRVIQFIIFGLHFLALICFLIFMLTFKIKKLF